MMAGFMSYFGGRRDPKQAARDAIVELRQQLQMLEKKDEYLERKIEEETRKAKANAATNKGVATAALRRRKMLETDRDRLNGTRFQLEQQVTTLESANLNAETMKAMKSASDALKVIHGTLTPTKVEATMDSINEQRELAEEISTLISNPMGAVDVDEDELKEELAELEREELDERLMGAERVPIHTPSGPAKVTAEPSRHQTEDEAEEERQLKELQAQLAM